MNQYDYFTTRNNDEIFICRASFKNKTFLGRLTYFSSSVGTKFMKGNSYEKGNLAQAANIRDYILWSDIPQEISCLIPAFEILNVYDPHIGLQKCFRQFSEINTTVSEMNKYEIPIEQLGIIGSYLFECNGHSFNARSNDQDYVIYNRDLLPNLMSFLNENAEPIEMTEDWLKRDKFFEVFNVPIQARRVIHKRQWFRRRILKTGREVSFCFPSTLYLDSPNEISNSQGKINIKSKVTNVIDNLGLPLIYQIDNEKVNFIIAFGLYWRGFLEVGDTVIANGQLIQMNGVDYLLIRDRGDYFFPDIN